MDRLGHIALDTQQIGTRVNKLNLDSFGCRSPVAAADASAPALAIGALDQAHLIAVHTLEGDKLGGEVIPMHRLLGAIARGAGQQAEAAARLAGIGRSNGLSEREREGIRLSIRKSA